MLDMFRDIKPQQLEYFIAVSFDHLFDRKLIIVSITLDIAFDASCISRFFSTDYIF